MSDIIDFNHKDLKNDSTAFNFLLDFQKSPGFLGLNFRVDLNWLISTSVYLFSWPNLISKVTESQCQVLSMIFWFKILKQPITNLRFWYFQQYQMFENCNFIKILQHFLPRKRCELKKTGVIWWTERNRRENRNWSRYETSMTLILAAVHLILSIFSHQIKIWWDNDLIITVGYR